MTDLRCVWMLLLSGCVVTGSGGAFEGTTTISATTTTADVTTPASFGSSGAGETMDKLDVAGRDIAAMECSSIEQTTSIVDRPSDVMVVADDAFDVQLVQSIITNLLPAMETEGVFDANVVLIVEGEAPDDGSEGSCGAWNCRGSSSFDGFTVLQRSIEPGGLVRDLLDAEGEWSPILREASWKHVWLLSSSLSTEGALEDLQTATDPGVVVHALVSQDGVGDPEGVLGLTEATGGVYAQGDFLLDDFFEPLLARIRSTALACEYDIPVPPTGFVFDPGEVNVDYDDGGGLQVIGGVDSAQDCVDVSGGWYYDDPIDPERIVMCPQTCALFAPLQEASIEIRFGCVTTPAE